MKRHLVLPARLGLLLINSSFARPTRRTVQVSHFLPAPSRAFGTCETTASRLNTHTHVVILAGLDGLHHFPPVSLPPRSSGPSDQSFGRAQEYRRPQLDTGEGLSA
jgi:hypothetical protein